MESYRLLRGFFPGNTKSQFCHLNPRLYSFYFLVASGSGSLMAFSLVQVDLRFFKYQIIRQFSKSVMFQGRDHRDRTAGLILVSLREVY